MWFVLDNALVLPEYLVEFEYITNLKTNGSDIKKSEGAIDILLNEDTNKLLSAINGA